MRNIELGEQMLVSAVRYALGRQTYIVKQTVDEVLRVWDQLSPGVQAVISRDVRDADSWGVECDEEQWMRVLECGGFAGSMTWTGPRTGSSPTATAGLLPGIYLRLYQCCAMGFQVGFRTKRKQYVESGQGLWSLKE